MLKEGYEQLHEILIEAYTRAAHGKGNERHANGEPFTDQWIVQGGLKYGTGALFFQLRKKLDEHERLDADAGDNELLDVINYAAAAVLVRRLQRQQRAAAKAAAEAGHIDLALRLQQAAPAAWATQMPGYPSKAKP